MISREEENSIKAEIKRTIAQLTREKLRKAFEAGQSDYVVNTPDTAIAAVKSIVKTVATIGVSDFFRSKKAESRLPTPEEINKNDPKKVLKKFLLGDGGTDKQSLKYWVLSHLLDLSAKSDAGATDLIKMVLEALGHQVKYDLSSISQSVTKKLDDQYDQMFKL